MKILILLLLVLTVFHDIIQDYRINKLEENLRAATGLCKEVCNINDQLIKQMDAIKKANNEVNGSIDRIANYIDRQHRNIDINEMN